MRMTSLLDETAMWVGDLGGPKKRMSVTSSLLPINCLVNSRWSSCVHNGNRLLLKMRMTSLLDETAMWVGDLRGPKNCMSVTSSLLPIRLLGQLQMVLLIYVHERCLLSQAATPYLCKMRRLLVLLCRSAWCRPEPVSPCQTSTRCIGRKQRGVHQTVASVGSNCYQTVSTGTEQA